MARHTAVPETAPGFFLSVLKPLLFSLFVTFLSLCLLAGFIAYGPVSEQATDACILASTILSVFLAGFMFARQKGSRGFMWGGLAGILYSLAAYVFAALCFGSMSPGMALLKLAVRSAAAGAFGGIAGVNARRRKRA